MMVYRIRLYFFTISSVLPNVLLFCNTRKIADYFRQVNAYTGFSLVMILVISEAGKLRWDRSTHSRH